MESNGTGKRRRVSRRRVVEPRRTKQANAAQLCSSLRYEKCAHRAPKKESFLTPRHFGRRIGSVRRLHERNVPSTRQAAFVSGASRRIIRFREIKTKKEKKRKEGGGTLERRPESTPPVHLGRAIDPAIHRILPTTFI